MAKVTEISKIKALKIFQFLKDTSFDYKSTAEKFDLTTLELFKLVEMWDNENKPIKKKKETKIIPINNTSSALDKANAVLLNEFNENTEDKDETIAEIEVVKLASIKKLGELINVSESLRCVTNTLKVLHEITLETKLFEKDNGDINNSKTDRFIQNIEKQLVVNMSEQKTINSQSL